jgi:hypothetical protein
MEFKFTVQTAILLIVSSNRQSIIERTNTEEVLKTDADLPTN